MNRAPHHRDTLSPSPTNATHLIVFEEVLKVTHLNALFHLRVRQRNAVVQIAQPKQMTTTTQPTRRVVSEI